MRETGEAADYVMEVQRGSSGPALRECTGGGSVWYMGCWFIDLIFEAPRESGVAGRWGAWELGSSHGDCPYADPGPRVRFLVLLLKKSKEFVLDL